MWCAWCVLLLRCRAQRLPQHPQQQPAPPAAHPQRLARFSVWRWCFFLGCWPPIYWATRLLMWGLTKFAECRLFTARTAVYFLVGAWRRFCMQLGV